MTVLIACEVSGRVRDAFLRHGIDAVSCDLLPTMTPGPHIQGDVIPLLARPWDAMIAFPPCTYLCSSGLHWNKRRPERAQLTEQALEFVEALFHANAPYIAIENPVGCISTRIRKPDQIVQPWMFGEDASKATCLWLKGLPKLAPTEVLLKKRYANQTPSGQNKLGPSATRALLRGLTYDGLASAMAAQWGPTIARLAQG